MLTLRLALLGLLLSISLASCTGEGTPVQGPDKASCNSGLAPVDIHLPANTCGVYPLEIPEPTARHFPQIPRNYVAQSVSVDLYIEGSETCGIGLALCGVDDNRPFVSKDSPDPGADPSRTRAHMILDFASGTLTLRISPSCRIHVFEPGLNLNNQKECFAPKKVGEGTSLTVTEPRHGTVGVELTVIQTNYPTLLNLGEVHNYWEFTPHPDGTVDITGSGTNFPDFDVIHYGRLVCADRGVHLSNVFAPPPIGQRSYNCHEVGLGDQLIVAALRSNSSTLPGSKAAGSTPSGSQLPSGSACGLLSTTDVATITGQEIASAKGGTVSNTGASSSGDEECLYTRVSYSEGQTPILVTLVINRSDPPSALRKWQTAINTIAGPGVTGYEDISALPGAHWYGPGSTLALERRGAFLEIVLNPAIAKPEAVATALAKDAVAKL